MFAHSNIVKYYANIAAKYFVALSWMSVSIKNLGFYFKTNSPISDRYAISTLTLDLNLTGVSGKYRQAQPKNHVQRKDWQGRDMCHNNINMLKNESYLWRDLLKCITKL